MSIEDIKNQIQELNYDLDSDPETLLAQLDGYTEHFYQQLDRSPTFRKTGYEWTERDKFLNVDEAASFSDIVRYLNERVHPHGLKPASGGHLGYIPGGGIYEAAIGDYIADVSNEYAGVHYASPGAVRIENSLIRWTADLIGYDEKSAGNLTSGGSIANLIAVTTARNSLKIDSTNVRNSVIYLSQQAHHSLYKAIKITGLHECMIRHIPLDEGYRIKPEALTDMITEDRKEGRQPFLVISNGGSTDAGAVDPLDEISNIAAANNMWHHVDAAYGGYFLLTEHGRKKLNGVDKADSVVADPHKGLFLPYGTGIVLVKNGIKLKDTFTERAGYMQDTVDYNHQWSPADLSPELSKPFRGLRMWLPLKMHGVENFKVCLEEKLLLARYFYESVKNLGYETGPYPDLSVVMFRWPGSNEENHSIVDYLHQHSKIFISSTTIDGTFWMRVAILSFRTHLGDINHLINDLNYRTMQS